jgi:antibiotic biosynthesis monooxygenase (ABM) superfamily enzyme
VDAAAGAPAAVAVTVQRTVRPGREGDYEQWLHGVIAAAGRFPGHLGAEVVRPPRGGRAYILLFRFDTLDHLLAWEASDERRRWVAEADTLTEGPAATTRVTGLETWFALPGEGPLTPPPRWKMALVSWAAAFPLIQALNAAATPTLSFLPPLVRGAAVGLMMVLLMTYAAMPLLTRALAGWLYPDRR